MVRILTLTEEETRSVLEEQLTGSGKGPILQSAGLGYETDAQGRVRGPILLGGSPWPAGRKAKIAFSSFDAGGAGGRYPVLKSIAESGKVNRRDTELTVRGAFRDLIGKEYGPKP